MTDSFATSKHFSKMNPELATILQTYGNPKPLLPERDQIQHYRQIFTASTARLLRSPFVQKHLTRARARCEWTESDIEIPVDSNAAIRARIYQPQRPIERFHPVLLVVHGGGWCMGDLGTESFVCRYICATLKIVVVNVDYRLYPEVQFPVPIHDVYHAMKWISCNALNLGIDLAQGFIALGVSGGGNHLNSAIYLSAQDRSRSAVRLSGYALLCTGMPHQAHNPAMGETINLFPPETCPSWQECQDAPLMSRETNQKFLEVANPPITSPLFTPFLQSSHANLPPRLYYQVAGLDPWRDSAFTYKRVLEEAARKEPQSSGKDGGMEVRMDVYQGLPHCWWTVWPQIQETEKWLDDLVQGVKWLLEGVTEAGKPESDFEDKRREKL